MERGKEIAAATKNAWIAIAKYNIVGVIMGMVFGLGVYFSGKRTDQFRLHLSVAFFLIPFVIALFSSLPFVGQLLRLKRSSKG